MAETGSTGTKNRTKINKAASSKTKTATNAPSPKAHTSQPYDAPLFKNNATSKEEIVAAADRALVLLTNVRTNLSQIIFGQEDVIEQVLTTVLAGGHALLVGVPGLAKTKLVESLGTVLGLDAKRIQFTPDLMPTDIVGSEVMEEDAKGKRSFRYLKGPVFTQLLMGDEINRASPRTQAALLQAMQEYYVTIAGQKYDLPRPFHVLATQNPLEQEGTYPLPEAQLDRFLMQVSMSYPDRETERQIVLATTGREKISLQAALSAERLLEMQQLVRSLPMPENVLNAILTLVRSCRPIEEPTQEDTSSNNKKVFNVRQFIAWGPGPRAAQALALCVRARALLQGRFAPAIADVKALAKPVLEHRMALNFNAQAENISLAALLEHLSDNLE